MNLIKNVQVAFEESVKTKLLAKDTLAEKVAIAGKLMADCLRADRKILSCGNGGSAADSQHFVGELINRLYIERRSLSAIALNTDTSTITAIANDYSYDDIFAKPLSALGKNGDVLLVISTSGNSKNILQAIKIAHELNLVVIALTGCDGGKISKILRPNDVEIRVPSKIVTRIQETHILILHCLCELIDIQLFQNT
ncbi:MAG: phosphoheptose isomerase [Gammaproteobacteria bacterium]